MIDMREIFSHPEYAATVEEFEEYKGCEASTCQWGIFKKIHKEIAHNKCPICEIKLDTSTPKSSGTIDHFRPQAKDMYPDLKCEPKNYILMCNLCNTRYKESKFPLVDKSKRATHAKTMEETKGEQPLLFNPAEENPLYFFELAFRQTEKGGILELKERKNLSKDSYAYQRSEAMINLFGLGYVHENIHPDEEAKELRVDILTTHYETFIKLAQAIKNKDKKLAALILLDKNRKEMLEKHGFFQFLLTKQFYIY
mgnify:CR=1 FL=1